MINLTWVSHKVGTVLVDMEQDNIHPETFSVDPLLTEDNRENRYRTKIHKFQSWKMQTYPTHYALITHDMHTNSSVTV